MNAPSTRTTTSAPAIRGSFLRCLFLLPYHPELEFQQIWLGTAGGLRVLPVPFVKGLTAFVERVDHILAPVLLECVFLEAVLDRTGSRMAGRLSLQILVQSHCRFG